MASYRPGSLRTLLLCSVLGVYPLWAQQAPAPQPPKPANPFGAVTEAQQPKAPPTPSDTIELIEFRGSRRVPQDTLRAMIFTKRGDVYMEEALHRDLMTLWNTQRFD